MVAPVNRIIDTSFVDGPGNRTAIFFQGCNYRCKYCHNPETIRMCTDCGECVSNCPTGALSLRDGKVVWNEKLCCKCDTCLKSCPNLSSPRVTMMTVDQVMDRVKKNAPFIKGISTSGGECTLRKGFLMELFPRVHELGLTCLIDSNGSMDFSRNMDLLNVTDGVMLDVKSTDPEEYEDLIGGDGRGILDKAVFLASLGKLTEVRTVCSPDFLSEKTVDDVSRALAEYYRYGDIHYRIITYRQYGVRSPYREQFRLSTPQQMEELRQIAVNNGMKHVSVV